MKRGLPAVLAVIIVVLIIVFISIPGPPETPPEKLTSEAPIINSLSELSALMSPEYCDSQIQLIYRRDIPLIENPLTEDEMQLWCSSLYWISYGTLRGDILKISNTSPFLIGLGGIKPRKIGGHTFLVSADNHVAILCGDCRKGDNYIIYAAFDEEILVDILAGRQKDYESFNSVCNSTDSERCALTLKEDNKHWDRYWSFTKGSQVISIQFGVDVDAKEEDMPPMLRYIVNESHYYQNLNDIGYYRDNSSFCIVTMGSTCHILENDMWIEFSQYTGRIENLTEELYLQSMLSIIREAANY